MSLNRLSACFGTARRRTPIEVLSIQAGGRFQATLNYRRRIITNSCIPRSLKTIPQKTKEIDDEEAIGNRQHG